MRNEKMLLRDEIQKEVGELGGLKLGSDEYKATVDGVTKMMDRVIEMEKLDIEHQDRIDARDEENQIKMAEIKENRKDRITKNTISILGIIIPVGLTIWGTKYTTSFEKDDSVTTTAGRQFFGNLFKFKR